MEGGTRPGFDLIPVAFDGDPRLGRGRSRRRARRLPPRRRRARRPSPETPRRRPRSRGARRRDRAAPRRFPPASAATPSRAFFEAHFEPVEVRPHDGPAFFTGYYEPIVAAARHRSPAFPVPLYAPPDDLVEIDPDHPPPGIEPGWRFARRTPGGFAPYLDRGEIEAGALARPWARDRLAGRSDRRLLHPRPGRRPASPRRGRRDARHLRRQVRPSLHRDRPRAGGDGRAAARRRDDADHPRLARRASRARPRRSAPATAPSSSSARRRSRIPASARSRPPRCR